ncbi:cytochrome c oxidase subunit II [Poriferisphaera sp. WC338]|uniref:cytochrome c oxidase subunit II n=1 Tax=Poriferisphaera sp. WC338 TaxID=3425129 RepID=UPI003D8155F4
MISILAQTATKGISMPAPVSTYAGEVDWLWNVITWVSVFFTVLIAGAMIFFIIKYRRQTPDDQPHAHTHNTALEVTWTIIPLIIVLMIFVWGFRGFVGMATPPSNSYEVLVTAKKWSWIFTYPNGANSDVLHVPADRPIKLILESVDVIHSFYVPAFRTKKDVVPGRYNETWFEVKGDRNGITAENPGEYDLFCAEYCGRDHSRMTTKVVVHTQESFNKWLEEASNPAAGLTLPQYGEKLYRRNGCNACHSINGSAIANGGPTFKDLFGYPQSLKNGTTEIADDNFLYQAISQPNSHGIVGYQPIMPANRLKQDEITAIIAYIKSLSDKYQPEGEPAEEGASENTVEAPATE